MGVYVFAYVELHILTSTTKYSDSDPSKIITKARNSRLVPTLFSQQV